MLAVIGGFGSMAGNKMLLDSVEEGEQAIGVLKTEFSFQDQEHTASVVALVTEYKNDKVKVEQWKQEQIQANYENLQGFIMNIMEDKEMAYQDKVKAINNAKNQYNNTVSQISKDVIDARFELSRDVIRRSDELTQLADQKAKNELEIERNAIETARADLSLLAENYSLENYSTLPENVKQRFEELEKESNLPPGFTEVAIENFKEQNKETSKIMTKTDEQGNWTIVGLDKQGNVVAETTLAGAGKNTVSEPTNTVEKDLGVGDIGGWCGDFASRVSTASKVGDSWDEKINKVTTRENPKPGFKVAIPTGVTDSGTDNGHMAVVMAYNPVTKDFKVIQSNADGRQSRGEGEGVISLATYNIDDLNNQYGENWGFIPGELKGDYAKNAKNLGFTDPNGDSDGVYETEDYDNDIATKEEEDEEIY